MQCINSYGRPKIKFKTLDLAIIEAKRLNSQLKRIHKMVAYKCNICYNYHIGSNGKELNKVRNIYKHISF